MNVQRINYSKFVDFIGNKNKFYPSIAFVPQIFSFGASPSSSMFNISCRNNYFNLYNGNYIKSFGESQKCNQKCEYSTGQQFKSEQAQCENSVDYLNTKCACNFCFTNPTNEGYNKFETEPKYKKNNNNNSPYKKIESRVNIASNNIFDGSVISSSDPQYLSHSSKNVYKNHNSFSNSNCSKNDNNYYSEPVDTNVYDNYKEYINKKNSKLNIDNSNDKHIESNNFYNSKQPKILDFPKDNNNLIYKNDSIPQKYNNLVTSSETKKNNIGHKNNNLGSSMVINLSQRNQNFGPRNYNFGTNPATKNNKLGPTNNNTLGPRNNTLETPNNKLQTKSSFHVTINNGRFGQRNNNLNNTNNNLNNTNNNPNNTNNNPNNTNNTPNNTLKNNSLTINNNIFGHRNNNANNTLENKSLPVSNNNNNNNKNIGKTNQKKNTVAVKDNNENTLEYKENKQNQDESDEDNNQILTVKINIISKSLMRILNKKRNETDASDLVNSNSQSQSIYQSDITENTNQICKEINNSDLDYSELCKSLETEIMENKYMRESQNNNFISDKFSGKIIINDQQKNIPEQKIEYSKNISDDILADSNFDDTTAIYNLGEKNLFTENCPEPHKNRINGDCNKMSGKIIFDAPRKNSPKSNRILIDDFNENIDKNKLNNNKQIEKDNIDNEIQKLEKYLENNYISNSLTNVTVINLSKNIQTNEIAKNDESIQNNNVNHSFANDSEKEIVSTPKKLDKNLLDVPNDKSYLNNNKGKVSWNNLVDINYYNENKEKDNVINSTQIKENCRNYYFNYINSTNIYGENFSSTICVYQNHVDLNTVRIFDLTLDGNDINDNNLVVIGDFIHMKISLYSFVGKKKNKKLIYNSLTEYDIWAMKNRNEHYLFNLGKNDKNNPKMRDADRMREEVDNNLPSDFIDAEIIYSQDPLICSIFTVKITNNKLYITIKFNNIFPKLYSTNYCNIQLNLFKKTI
jgi:hypothetical protein